MYLKSCGNPGAIHKKGIWAECLMQLSDCNLLDTYKIKHSIGFFQESAEIGIQAIIEWQYFLILKLHRNWQAAYPSYQKGTVSCFFYRKTHQSSERVKCRGVTYNLGSAQCGLSFFSTITTDSFDDEGLANLSVAAKPQFCAMSSVGKFQMRH